MIRTEHVSTAYRYIIYTSIYVIFKCCLNCINGFLYLEHLIFYSHRIYSIDVFYSHIRTPGRFTIESSFELCMFLYLQSDLWMVTSFFCVSLMMLRDH